eukprot:TRINITY_DN2338_c0_g1_i1.p2 TRINITY_DN2338_c0_g1~~TRINITY_DN2338_c0_g1_i1.p2  ORF type:complete len:149 (+),score=36.92 TRINITY_DN2338_c0_g1_i1:54-449(+)
MGNRPLVPADLNTTKIIFYVLAGVLFILELLCLINSILLLLSGYWDPIYSVIVCGLGTLCCALGIYGVMKGIRVYVFYYMIFVGILCVLIIIDIVLSIIYLSPAGIAVGVVMFIFYGLSFWYAYVLWADRL